MTTLEKWASEWADLLFETAHDKRIAIKGYMAGFQRSSELSHTPPEPCPPGHNCPDCGSSIVEGVTD